MTRNPDRKWLSDFNFMSFNGDAKGQLHANDSPYLNHHQPELELAQEQTLEEDNTLLSNVFNQVSTALHTHSTPKYTPKHLAHIVLPGETNNQ